MEKVVDPANAVQFHVKSIRSLHETGEVFFYVIKQNIGNAFKRVFIAPVAGIYFFKLTASWGNLGGYLYLRKNYKNIGPFQKDEDTFKTPILKLDAGDEISVYVHVTSTSYYLQGFYGRSESTGISPELFGVLLYEINQEIEHTTYGPLHKEWVPLVNQWIG